MPDVERPESRQQPASPADMAGFGNACGRKIRDAPSVMQWE